MKMIRSCFMVAAALATFACSGARAQAPASAPAGSTGICKDGTYSTAASKSGACRGHKGVQTWYAASVGSATPASVPITGGAKPSATPSPTPTQAAPAKPAPPSVAPSMAGSPGAAPSSTPKRQSPAAAAAARTAAPGGAPGLVWVNTGSNVYHCYGDTYYGKTKAGAYMSEADAKAKGAHGERGKTCSK